MASKPKIGGDKKPAERKMTKAEQSERFIQAARDLGVDETGKDFEEALRKILSPKAK